MRYETFVINGAHISVADKEAITELRLDSIPLGWGLFFVKPLTNGAIANAAELNGTFDYAVPEEWRKENAKEFERRGGAVWHYDEVNRIFGAPVFFDTLLNRVRIKIKKEVLNRAMPERKLV